MRVMHVISDENIGGAGVLLTTLLRNFDRGRVQSRVALPQNSRLSERIAALDIPIHSLQYPCDRFSLRSVRELSRLMEREGVDLVHANAALCARIAARRTRTAVLHTRHCCFPPTGIWKNQAVRKIGGVWNRSLSDRVIATAQAAAEDLQRLGIPDRQIEVILNGSEPIREVGETELAVFRNKWGIQKGDFVVGISARLAPCKGHETFLRAAKLACKSVPDIAFRFLIAGDGSRRAELENMSHLLGISNHVVFCGFLEDMAPFYRVLRLNVNCSNGTETSCLALSEGMSAGVPMAVSDYGGNRDMVGESEAGIVFPVGNESALAEAIVGIASDPSKEARMRSAAYARYLARYTASGMTERVTDLYERLLFPSAFSREDPFFG